MPEEYRQFSSELNFSHYYPLGLKISDVVIKNIALEKNWNQNREFFVEIPEKILESYAYSRFQRPNHNAKSHVSYLNKVLYVVIDNVTLNPVPYKTRGKWGFLKEWLPVQRQEDYEFLVTMGFYVLNEWEVVSTPSVEANTITLRRVMRLHEGMTLEQREATQRAFLHHFIKDLDLYIQETLRNKLQVL